MRKKCKNEKVYNLETNIIIIALKNEHYCNVLYLGIHVEPSTFKLKLNGIRNELFRIDRSFLASCIFCIGFLPGTQILQKEKRTAQHIKQLIFVRLNFRRGNTHFKNISFLSLTSVVLRKIFPSRNSAI